MTQELWRWPEESRHCGVPSGGGKLYAGFDVGTTSTQAALLSGGRLFGWASVRTGADIRGAALRAFSLAAGDSGLALPDLAGTCGTGYGAEYAPRADRCIDEVSCHARGARYMFGGSVRTVLDLGGQTVKAIRLYDWGRVRDIMLGDKCATGMGRGIELTADLMQIPITEMGERSFRIEKEPEPVSTTCRCFQVSETFNLLRPEFRGDDHTANEALASYLFSIAWRALGVVGKLAPLDRGGLKVEEGLALTGGLAKNCGITRRIERELGLHALESEYDPMLAGAIGAALLAAEES